jgi:hypothetical protein
MDQDLNQKCNQHKNRYDCPDALIAVNRGEYGLIIHDGGPSYIVINFCPWCGTKYQPTRRSRWRELMLYELRLPVENAE